MWVQKVTGAGIDALTYAPDGRTLYTLDGLYRLAAWDVATREAKQLGRLLPADRGGIFRLLVSPDGRFLVGVRSGESIVWDAATGREHARERVPWSKEAQFVPGTSRLAMLDTARHACDVWDVATDRIAPLVLPGWPETGEALSFDFAPDGRTTAVLRGSGEVALGDTASDEVVGRITVPHLGPWLAHARFAPDGNTLLLFTSNQLVLWDVARGAARAEVRGPLLFDYPFALNPTLPVFASLDAKSVLTLYSLDTGKPLRSLDFMLGRYVRCVCFAPDGLTCAVGGSNRQFAVFDVDV